MSLSEQAKADRYEAVSPGTGLPIEQRAERYDRLEVKNRLGKNQGRKRKMPTKYFTFENATCWCECGKFKHEGNC